MIKAVFFDLDGSLLPMEEEMFTKHYFDLLCKKVESYSYDKEKFVQTVWAGIKAIKKNDGLKFNEEVFWDVFSSVYGVEESIKIKKFFNLFYTNEFKQTKAVCFENPHAKEIIDFCKQKGLKIALTTSPFFPKEGVVSRLEFLELSENDFDFITHYSNMKSSKPQKTFYKQVMDFLDVKPNEVVMFGNSESDDGIPMFELGVKVYMVGDFVSIAEDYENHFEKIKLNEVVETLNKIINNYE